MAGRRLLNYALSIESQTFFFMIFFESVLLNTTKLLKSLIIFLVLISWMPVCWSQTYVIGGYDYPPFIYAKANKGIYVDLMAQLARTSQLAFKWEHYPYARLDALFNKARVQIEVGSSPLWTASKDIPGFYSVPFYILKDVVVFRSGEKVAMNSYSDLAGKRVGLVRGYSFPQFQKAFDEGLATRIDANNELSLMNLLLKNRVDQIFISLDLFLYYRKIHKEFIGLIPGDIVGAYEVAIRIHPQYKQLLGPLNKGIAALKESGDIQRIINKHLR